ncbi:uncharacterized protein [Petaurus breviceps papuanus]|uniref:uncharacterized protein n=1 Tax=Petaurus breviceps papuanus TaxID=3040969 RepID=UPI0036DBDF7E
MATFPSGTPAQVPATSHAEVPPFVDPPPEATPTQASGPTPMAVIEVSPLLTSCTPHVPADLPPCQPDPSVLQSDPVQPAPPSHSLTGNGTSNLPSQAPVPTVPSGLFPLKGNGCLGWDN